MKQKNSQPVPKMTHFEKLSIRSGGNLLRISSVNVTKSAVTCDLVTFTEEILHEKPHFCAVKGPKYASVPVYFHWLAT